MRPAPLLAALILMAGGSILWSKSYALTAYNPSPSVSVISPAQYSTLSNTNLSARLNNVGLNDYNMFWYVDNGSWNWMGNSPNGVDSKQAAINFTNWTWHQPSNLYTITVVAVVNGSGQRYYSGVQIYVSNQPANQTSGG